MRPIKSLQLDKRILHLLLCCLEEVMKCNGDIKLAAIPKRLSAVVPLNGQAPTCPKDNKFAQMTAR